MCHGKGAGVCHGKGDLWVLGQSELMCHSKGDSVHHVTCDFYVMINGTDLYQGIGD